MVKICPVVLEMMLMHNDERQHRAIVHLSDSGDLKCQHISMNASFFDKLDFSSPYMVKNIVPALSQIKDILMKLLIKSRLLTDQQSQTLFFTGINKGIVLIFERGELINWCNNLKPILKQTYQQGHLQDFK